MKVNSQRILKWLIIISIIVVVVVFIVQHIIGIINKEKTKELQADLLLVQAKVEIVKGKNNMNKDENPLKGIQLSKIAEIFKIKDKVEIKNISAEELEKYYILRQSDLSTMDLQELVGKNNGDYIVNYDNYEVIYTSGYENANGLWCYKISDLNKQPENLVTIPASSTNTEEKQEENKENTQEASKEENKQENENTEQQATSEPNQDNQVNQAEENKTEEGTSQVNVEEVQEKRIYVLNKIKNVIK